MNPKAWTRPEAGMEHTVLLVTSKSRTLWVPFKSRTLLVLSKSQDFFGPVHVPGLCWSCPSPGSMSHHSLRGSVGGEPAHPSSLLLSLECPDPHHPPGDGRADVSADSAEDESTPHGDPSWTLSTQAFLTSWAVHRLTLTSVPPLVVDKLESLVFLSL